MDPTIDDAPAGYGNEEASAWLIGVEHGVAQAAEEVDYLRAENQRLVEQVEAQHEVNHGWSKYGGRVAAERREWAEALRAALGLPEEDRARHIPHLIEKVAALRLDYEAGCHAQDYVTERLTDVVDDAGLDRPENLGAALDAVGVLVRKAMPPAPEVPTAAIRTPIHHSYEDGETP